MLRKIFPVNVNKTERVARVGLGFTFLILTYFKVLPDGVDFYSAFFGALGLVSGIVGHCPVFSLFNIKTTE
ncbi:MAG: DUF2892 domain-containing protein [Deltaproteobacteria bacterium]|nr:DUF2892 domain-containing protein [Deltaproteobacteria bacterium]